MDKIMTIVRREYLSRVKSKAFLISTFLFPLLIAVIMIIPILAATNVEKEEVTVYVDDQSGQVLEKILASSSEFFHFKKAQSDFELYKTGDLLAEGELALQIPANLGEEKDINSILYSKNKVVLQVQDDIEGVLRKAVREFKLKQAGISEEALDDTKFSLRVSTRKIGEDGKEESASVEAAAITGYVMSFLIYFMLLFYGMFVMRGVIEEKTNRIVEIMISSVKPFQLMMGKLIGICAVGLTQIFLWMILGTIMFTVVGSFFASNMEIDPDMLQNLSNMQTQNINIPQSAEIMHGVMQALSLKNILLFIFYFLGGYMLYGALFAAVGSAVDQESDAQQFTFPVMMPLILPMLLIGNIIQSPNGTLAVVFSHIPFTSPIIMMMRATSVEVPWYEMLLSMALLVLGIWVCVWIAGRIYRVGILMYGKKVTFREIGKWIFRY